MKTRKLGDLTVSALGLGCMPMIGEGNISYGAADETESLKTLDAAIERGVTFFDTAEVYGPYTNERLLGRAIKGKRDGLVIATKFGFRISEDGRMIGTDSSPANIKRACEGSLQRLGIEVIDLYYQHRVDPDTPIEETVGAMGELVKEGKVRAIGLSECGPETLARAVKVHRIAALQSEYSLWERGVEADMLPLCREHGIGFVPYSPLGRGFLTGEIAGAAALGASDYRRGDPRHADENAGRNQTIVDAVRTVAKQHGVSAAQVALAWLLAQGEDIVPIPGSKRRVTMNDSMDAAEVVLGADDLAALDAAAPAGGTAGLRYTERGMATVRL